MSAAREASRCASWPSTARTARSGSATCHHRACSSTRCSSTSVRISAASVSSTSAPARAASCSLPRTIRSARSSAWSSLPHCTKSQRTTSASTRVPARRCQNVRSVCADAATFALPEHDCVLYFNNPFAEPVFARVLGNVQAAHERSHRKLHVLYQQLAGELETDRTHNLAMLERSVFLRERQVRFPHTAHAASWVPTSYGCSNPSISRRRSRHMPLSRRITVPEASPTRNLSTPDGNGESSPSNRPNLSARERACDGSAASCGQRGARSRRGHRLWVVDGFSSVSAAQQGQPWARVRATGSSPRSRHADGVP